MDAPVEGHGASQSDSIMSANGVRRSGALVPNGPPARLRERPLVRDVFRTASGLDVRRLLAGEQRPRDGSEAEPKAGMSGSCRASRGGATGPAGVIMAFAAALAFARRSRRRAGAR